MTASTPRRADSLRLQWHARSATTINSIRFRTKDFYSLQAVFANTRFDEFPLAPKSRLTLIDLRRTKSDLR